MGIFCRRKEMVLNSADYIFFYESSILTGEMVETQLYVTKMRPSSEDENTPVFDLTTTIQDDENAYTESSNT